MREERARILELLREGKISVDEAEDLLDALGAGEDERDTASADDWLDQKQGRRLCVRITDLNTGRVKVNVRVPAGAWSLLRKLTRTRLGRHMSGIAMHELRRAAKGGAGEHLVDVADDKKGERVEIFFE